MDLIDIETHILTYSDKSFYKERCIGRLNNIKPIEIQPPQYAIDTSFPRRKNLMEPRFKGKNKLYETYNSKIIKKDLDPIQDEDTIRQFELIGMELNENLTARLIYFYETGLDIDLSKLNIFYPSEFIKYLEIFYDRFKPDGAEADLQGWKIHLSIPC